MSCLHLNIFPINVPDVEVSVGIFPYDSKDVMRNLREKHFGTHVFKRVSLEENGQRKDLIYSIKLDGSSCDLSPKIQKIRLKENLGVARQLVEESFVSSFAGKPDRKLVNVRPLKVLSAETQHNFITQAVTGANVPAWLVVRLAHTIEARIFQFEGQDAFLGLTFDHHAYRRIARPCSEWIADKFDLTGLYVSEKFPFNDSRIEPRLRLVGRVERVDGNTLHLSDCREGRSMVDAKDVEVEADFNGFMRCLTGIFGGKAKFIDRKLFELQCAAQVGPKKLSELLRVENRLTSDLSSFSLPSRHT